MPQHLKIETDQLDREVRRSVGRHQHDAVDERAKNLPVAGS
jgi:hypothetical protein